jgi:hypothetical protein
MEFNSPAIVGAVWADCGGSAPGEAEGRGAVSAERLPILLLWGERGAGKTKTADTIIQPFFSDFSGPRKVDEMTRFTFMTNAHASNLVPTVYDEYKPSKLSPVQVQQVSSFLRSSYDAQIGERGGVDPRAGDEPHLYTYTAPWCWWASRR